MIPGAQPKLLLTLDESKGDGKLILDEDIKELLGLGEDLKWKLVRERDGLTKTSGDVTWMEWNADGTFKARHPKIGIGYSLMMSPFNHSFTWQTTEVTEILEEDEFYIKFKTKNSTYTLTF
jgi:hypothetical protein